VLDTNVIVLAQISPFGIPAKVFNLVFSEEIALVYDNAILFEYTNVLNRKILVLKKRIPVN
jgi:predicted nucleic acid-binding protein